VPRTAHNFAGTSTAQQTATVRKKQAPISVRSPLRLMAAHTTENSTASTAARDIEPHNSANWPRRDTGGRTTGGGSGRRSRGRGARARGGGGVAEPGRGPPARGPPTASTARAISTMLPKRWAGFLDRALATTGT